MDYGSVDRYVERCIRSEKRMWGKAVDIEIPDIKLDDIEDADIRRQVKNARLALSLLLIFFCKYKTKPSVDSGGFHSFCLTITTTNWYIQNLN